MKKFIPSLVVLVCALFAVSIQAQVAPEQARNFQINETHTGSTTVAHLTPPLRQKWSVNFGRSPGYPIIADGRVYVVLKSTAGNGTSLYALNGATGATLWAWGLGGVRPWSALCYENGRLFALNSDGILRAFDSVSGDLIWQVGFPNEYSVDAPPTAFQGVVYVGGASSGRVYAVNASNGAVLWTRSVFGGAQSSPAVTNEGVYVSYSCPNVYKLNPANGAVIWHYAPGCSGGGGKTAALYNNRLYVRDFSDKIFDSQTGTIIGSFNAKNTPAFSGNLGFFLNGPHYFGSYGTLEARDVDSNALVWSFTGDGFLQSAVLVVNNYVYVGSSQGKLYAVDAATGLQAWMTPTGATIPYVDEQNVSQPLTSFAAGEGLLVVPTSTTLVAYEGDSTPPTLTWGSQSPSPNASGWNNTAVDLSFTTADDFSGVQSATPESPLHFTSEGANQTQQVIVTDRSGNSATFTSPAVNIDLSAPSTSVVVSGIGSDMEWYSSGVTVGLNAVDGLSGVGSSFYVVDGGAVQTYSGPFSVSGDGSHTIEDWSDDVAGNVESHKTRTVRIDSSAPVTQIAVSGAPGTNGWYVGAVQVSLSSTDNLSGVANTYYSVDGSAVQAYTGPFPISGDGTHTVEYWSLDVAGNMESHQTRAANIDGTAPVTQSALSGASGANGWYVSAVQVSLTAADNLSGVGNTFYKVDGGAVQNYTGAFSISGDGTHTLEFWSADLAGNVESHQTRLVGIDTTAPVTQIALSGTAGSNGWYVGAVQASLIATDNHSGVQASYYRINGGATQTYTGAFSITAQGQHSVDYWTVDNAGKIEVTRSVVVKIDSVAPVVSATANPSSATKGPRPVTVTVSGSATDAISGIASASYNVIDEYGLNQPSGSITVQANGSYSFTLSLPATKNGNDKDGHLYTIVVRGFDRAGNSTTATTTLRIN
ncbi:MAG TPA: PQQ-binding-like beta-propeller repeat protein [Pyrinomonadaceae bacterium]|nr:PQQ-binding-like beta-propeller repeat protein [Pyrinomonadaceae bacterium]